MDSDQFRQAAHAAVEDIINYLENSQPTHIVPDQEFGSFQKSMPQSAPQQGEAWSDIYNDYKSLVQPQMTNWIAPNFAAFFPCGTSYSSILGELYAASYGGSFFSWVASPAATELEHVVMDWLARALALPEAFLNGDEGDGGGLMMTSASESILTVMVAARDRALRMERERKQAGRVNWFNCAKKLPNAAEDVDDGIGVNGSGPPIPGCYTSEESMSHFVVLGSETTHSSTKKAARILGLQFKTVLAPRDAGFAMTGSALAGAIQECLDDELQPIFVTATLGTTATCAIDDLPGIGEILKEHPFIWGHVDAACVGAALVCPEYKHLARDLGLFGSFNVNLNKWMFVNTDASCLFVQSRKCLARSLDITPSYLENDAQLKDKFYEPHHLSLTLTRRFRSLKVWFTLRTFGIEGLTTHIRAGVSLGEQFSTMLSHRADLFEIITGPAFALVTFRVRPALEQTDRGSADYNELCNDATRKVCHMVNSSNKAFVTGCEVGDLYVIRMVTSNINSNLDAMKIMLDMFVDAAEGIRNL
ncbi:PLP-dependent transferase [Ophiobolus disseminans]|uniref:PLP-dependent transferase n=1 Tax=Ophiobolus disseminans TaxID=1469910 RepID=A0A6A6ZYV6_9PLEO|nr:PLP-dependent transferase [Ophiobolus disseminans]